MREERCVCCGEIIPEGRQVCFACERTSNTNKDYKTMAERMMDGEIGPDEFVDYYNEIIDVEAERAMVLDPPANKREFT